MAETLLRLGSMQHLLFAQESVAMIPQNRRVKVVAAVVFHVLLVVMLIRVKTRPVRMSSGISMQAGMPAYIPGSIGTAGASPSAATPVQPKKVMAARVAKPAPQDEDRSDSGQSAASNAPAGGGGQAGPVRLGTGGNLTLLNKVTPIYPPVMQSVRMPGQVVLDAIIHRDGTIGDVTVLKSTNEAFTQAAIAAVKQWKYSPIPYEGIVTVTVNFQIPG
jgi:protein TonB